MLNCFLPRPLKRWSLWETLMIKRILLGAIIFSGLCTSYSNGYSAETIRVLTWEGYVFPEEVREVNNILKKEGYPYKVEVISPYAAGAEQMFRFVPPYTKIADNLMKMVSDRALQAAGAR